MKIQDTNIGEAIAEHWKLRVNQMYPEDGPNYPSEIAAFVDVEIDGDKKTFRVSIKEFKGTDSGSYFSGV